MSKIVKEEILSHKVILLILIISVRKSIYKILNFLIVTK